MIGLFAACLGDDLHLDRIQAFDSAPQPIVSQDEQNAAHNAGRDGDW